MIRLKTILKLARAIGARSILITPLKNEIKGICFPEERLIVVNWNKINSIKTFAHIVSHELAHIKEGVNHNEQFKRAWNELFRKMSEPCNLDYHNGNRDNKSDKKS
ncbi:MAG: hypothetical protein H5U06_07665 [Candidatus Aminicenantes bacterium]|nr:hypothetical protein [Candidatus Aminicenantes bacterium]